MPTQASPLRAARGLGCAHQLPVPTPGPAGKHVPCQLGGVSLPADLIRSPGNGVGRAPAKGGSCIAARCGLCSLHLLGFFIFFYFLFFFFLGFFVKECVLHRA